MGKRSRGAKINIRFLIVLMLLLVALGGSLVAVRQVRRSILSKIDRDAGDAAFVQQDWPAAARSYQEYLGRNPDDVEILKRYARASVSIRPLSQPNLLGGIAAYRRSLQLHPADRTACEALARLYTGLEEFDELAHIARLRLEHDPNDSGASVWLADALLRRKKTPEARQILEQLVRRLETLSQEQREYVEACARMGWLVLNARPEMYETPAGAEVGTETIMTAESWFQRAVDHAPDITAAYLYRAQFHRQAADRLGVGTDAAADRLAAAIRDLEVADGLGSDAPRVRLSLGKEWMAHGNFDRAMAELRVLDGLPPENFDAQYFDGNDWLVERFLFASQLAMRRGAMKDAVSLADEALATVSERGQRALILPSATLIYAVVGQAAAARRCLGEYVDMRRVEAGVGVSPVELGRLQALVARAEQRPYGVLDAVRPLLAMETTGPELWQLAAEAYSQIGQPRQAVAVLVPYLRRHPHDLRMQRQLVKEYLRLRDWAQALAAAQQAETLSPRDLPARLLRIEAGVYLAAGQGLEVDRAKLEALAAELEQLRQKYPAQIGIRLLQATVATYLQEPQKAEDYLRRATAECQEPWRAELELARHYVRTGRPAEAVEVGRAACRHQRQAAEPWLLLARLHVTNGDHDAGRQAVQQGLAAVASPWEKRSLSIELALLETGRGRPAAGIEILRSLAAQNERDVHVRALLLSLPEIRKDQAVAEQLIGELRQAEGEGGMWWRWHQASLWLASGQWQVKRQELADLLEYDIAAAPEWTGPVLLLAELHEKLGDAGHAEEVCRRGLARNPGALELADRLMSLLEKQGRAAEAREVFQKMALDPRVATAWRVGSALQDGDFVRAIEELKGRVTENGRDAEARILLARLLYGQNRDPNEAAGYLEQAQQIDPNSRAVLHARLLWLVAQNRWEELKGISGAYLTARSLDSQALLEAAAMLAAVDSPEIKKESVKLFERAASLLPASADAQLGWASTLYQMGDARGAQTVYRQWLTEHPDDARALNDLAWILQEDGRRYDEALELANRAVELGPDDPHFLDTRATILGKLPRRLREAREDVARLVALEPDRSPEKARALLRLGRICVQLHDLGPARQHLEAALALDREMNVLTEAERAEIRRIMPMAGI